MLPFLLGGVIEKRSLKRGNMSWRCQTQNIDFSVVTTFRRMRRGGSLVLPAPGHLYSGWVTTFHRMRRGGSLVLPVPGHLYSGWAKTRAADACPPPAGVSSASVSLLYLRGCSLLLSPPLDPRRKSKLCGLSCVSQADVSVLPEKSWGSRHFWLPSWHHACWHFKDASGLELISCH